MNKHILVTEDDKNVADGLREILESDGYTVSCADCASAAMQTMRDGGADLVILDVRLGQDDGYELCRRIREFSNVPILFLTACSSEIELVRGFRAGGDDGLDPVAVYKDAQARPGLHGLRAVQQDAVYQCVFHRIRSFLFHFAGWVSRSTAARAAEAASGV